MDRNVRYWYLADIGFCTAHVRYWSNSGHWNAKLKHKFNGVPRETEFKLKLRFNLWRCHQRMPLSLWREVRARTAKLAPITV